MAKLSGVVTNVQRISYNGAEYAAAEFPAQVGDIARCDTDEYSFLTNGAFYAVVEGTDDEYEGEPAIIDDEDDELDADGDDYTLFRKVTEPAARLRQYSEVSRKAVVGERIRVVKYNDEDHLLEVRGTIVAGEEFTVKCVDGDGDIFHVEERDVPGLIKYNRYEYVVLEPAESAASPEPVPSDSDTVTVDGVSYRKVTRPPAVGDSLLALRTFADWTEDRVYECVSVDDDGDPRAIDDAGGRHYFSRYTRGKNYEVLERVETSKLPDEYVIHGGMVYRKEARKAEAGEKVIVVSNTQHWIKVGEIVEAVSSGTIRANKAQFTDPDNFNDGSTQSVSSSQYNVLVPVDSVTIGGVSYTLEKRPATEGERILVVKAELAQGNYDNGAVLTIKTRDTAGIFVEGFGIGLYHREYVVLVPQQETAQLERLKVGDYAKQVGNPRHSNKRADGDIVLITEDGRSERPFKIDHIDGRWAGWAYESDLVRATDEEVTKAKRRAIKVGDTVRITEYVGGHSVGTVGKVVELCDLADYGNRYDNVARVDVGGRVYTEVNVDIAVPTPIFAVDDKVRLISGGGEPPLYGFSNGEIYTVANPDYQRSDGSRVQIKREGGGTGYATADQLEKLSVGKSEAIPAPNFVVGDSVRLVIPEGNRPRYGWGRVKNGDIGKITDISGQKVDIEFPAQSRWSRLVSEVEKVSAEEIEAARKKAEEDAKQAAETAKWAAIGRKPGEFKAGDVVRVIKSCGIADTKVGDITAVKELHSGGIALEQLNSAGSNAWIYAEEIELVTPAESRFDIGA